MRVRLRAEETAGAPLLAAQDTTEVRYTSHPATTGLGPIDGFAGSRGLFAHAALLMTGQGVPLGVAWLHLWGRDPAAFGRAARERSRLTTATADKESRKWREGLAGIEAALPPEQEVVILADREADGFDYLAAPRRANTHLSVRACQPRRVESVAVLESAAPAETPTDLLTAGAAAPELGRLPVRVPRQAGRPEREALLGLRACRVRVLPPQDHRRRGGGATTALEVTVLEARDWRRRRGRRRCIGC